MPRPDLEAKLTTAARQALDDLTQEYRDQILLAARDSASMLGEVREISVHDILAAVGRFQKRELGSRQALFQRVLSAYIGSGILLGFAGLIAFGYPYLIQGRSFREQLPLLLAVTGFGLSAVSYAYLKLRSVRVEGKGERFSREAAELPEYVVAYLARWRDLELSIRETAANRLGESVASAPLYFLIERLARDRLLSPEDSRRLRELSDLRNAILHSKQTIAQDTISGALRDAERLTTHLRIIAGGEKVRLS